MFDYRPGDGLDFSADGWTGLGIKVCSLGCLSHTAYLANYPADSDLLAVFESTSLSPLPCMIQRKLVEGVQCHGLAETIQNYPGKVWHSPLRVPLSRSEAIRLSEWSIDMCKRETPYDWLSAARARTLGFGWVRRYLSRTMGCTGSSESVQCSEFRAYGMGEVDRFDASDNPGLWSPVRLARRLRKRGTLLGGRRVK